MKKCNRPYYKPRVYLSAKVRSPNHKRNNLVTSYLRGQFDVFVPHEFQTCDSPHEDIPISVYHMDVTAMEQSDLVVLVPPYGKDCSYEVGWCVARGKPVFMFVGEEELSFISDAMVCGGVTAVFTDNSEVFQRLMLHPVLKHKTLRLPEAHYLGREVMDVFDEVTGGEILMETE